MKSDGDKSPLHHVPRFRWFIQTNEIDGKEEKMNKFTAAMFALLVSTQTGFCDWHHHGHDSSRAPDPAFEALLRTPFGAPDPAFDAFMSTCILILGASVAILLFAGPVFVIFLRRIRDLFWVVPLANTALYVLSISLQAYPGGFAARFQPPGLRNTILEVTFLLFTSLLVAVVLAIVQWMVRMVRSFMKKQKTDTDPSPPTSPSASSVRPPEKRVEVDR